MTVLIIRQAFKQSIGSMNSVDGAAVEAWIITLIPMNSMPPRYCSVALQLPPAICQMTNVADFVPKSAFQIAESEFAFLSQPD